MAQGPSHPPADSQNWVAGLGDFLVKEKVITQDELSGVLSLYSQIDKRIGHLASLKGYITPRDVFQILAGQLNGDGRFGDIAITKGLMTEEQVNQIVHLQKDPVRLFIESLLLSKLIPEEKLRNILHHFLQASGIKMLSDEEGGASHGMPLAPVLDDELYQERTEQLRTTMMLVMELSVMPMVVQRILSQLVDPEVVLDEVAKNILSDPVLSGRMLRVVNSATFGLRRKVASVKQAVMTLGINGVRQSILTASILEKFKSMDVQRAQAHWKFSLMAGRWAMVLAQEQKVKTAQDDLFVGGLLHDIGKLAILQKFPKAIQQLERMVAAQIPEAEAERKLVGLTHPEIGAMLCHHWNFPASLTQATLYHATTPFVLKRVVGRLPLTDIVNAASRLAGLKIISESEAKVDLSELEPSFLEFHKLKAERVAELAPEIIHTATQQVSEFLL